MASEHTGPGRILIVEDDYFIANDLANSFAEIGLEIVGAVPSLGKALAMIESCALDAAVLDVNLDGEKVYEVADALIQRDVPVVFVTGYDRPSLPDRYNDIPLCVKPVHGEKVIEALRRIGGF